MTPIWQLGNLVVAAVPGPPARSPPHSPPQARSPLAALTSQPLAMAKPPPRRRMMFQGTVSWTFFHVSKGSVSALEAGWREDT